MKQSTIERTLNQVDWNFSDYSSSQFPADINSLHWYPASFVPQIPAILIQALSDTGDLVLDPFAGSGGTLIEASRLGRRFIGLDQNPYAVNIANAKLMALSNTNSNWYNNEISFIVKIKPLQYIKRYCKDEGIDGEVLKWFEEGTLSELLALRRYVVHHKGSPGNLIRQVALSAILNRCCSQRDHYTYITDKCYPRSLVYRPALKMYVDQLNLMSRAVTESQRQYRCIQDREWDPSGDGVVQCHDARSITWVGDKSIDLVVTSPPYLGVNDYVRSMLLTSLLFKEDGTEEAMEAEIGARRKRHRRSAYDEYIIDMGKAFKEISRVLKPRGYLAIVLGQGKGKVNKGNVADRLLENLTDLHRFSIIFESVRRIKFRRIQVPGIGTEKIIVLQR